MTYAETARLNDYRGRDYYSLSRKQREDLAWLEKQAETSVPVEAPEEPAAEAATERQVAYALVLAERAGQAGYPQHTREALAALTKREASRQIDVLLDMTC